MFFKKCVIGLSCMLDMQGFFLSVFLLFCMCSRLFLSFVSVGKLQHGIHNSIYELLTFLGRGGRQQKSDKSSPLSVHQPTPTPHLPDPSVTYSSVISTGLKLHHRRLSLGCSGCRLAFLMEADRRGSWCGAEGRARRRGGWKKRLHSSRKISSALSEPFVCCLLLFKEFSILHLS